MKLVNIIGCNGTGKSTFIEHVKETYGAGTPADNSRNYYGTVEVGKLMRAKYPPEYFSGQGNPEHTQQEAWQMFLDGVARCQKAGNRLCLIDGQPRTLKQAIQMVTDFPEAMYAHFSAPKETRQRRLNARDSSDPSKHALAMARLDHDVGQNYEVLSYLLAMDKVVLGWDTNRAAVEDSHVLLGRIRETLLVF